MRPVVPLCFILRLDVRYPVVPSQHRPATAAPAWAPGWTAAAHAARPAAAPAPGARRLHHGLALVGAGGGGVAHGAGAVVVLHGPAHLGALAVAQDGMALGAILGCRAPVRACSMCTVSGARCSIIEVSISPPWMPKRCSCALNSPLTASGSGRLNQLLPYTSRPQRWRSSRATMSMAATLPPWPLNSSSFLMPARATHSPSSRPQRDQRAGRQRQRAGVGAVLGGQAQLLWRQKQHRQLGRQQRQRRIQHALQQRGIDRQRQVRPMLLDGGHGQHGHGLRGQAPGAGLGKVARGEVGPKAGGI